VHVEEFVTLDISRLDPSLAIGLYFACREDFEAFCRETREAAARKLALGRYPLFTVQQTVPAYMTATERETERTTAAAAAAVGSRKQTKPKKNGSAKMVSDDNPTSETEENRYDEDTGKEVAHHLHRGLQSSDTIREGSEPTSDAEGGGTSSDDENGDESENDLDFNGIAGGGSATISGTLGDTGDSEDDEYVLV
jgi:hypothetical protein